AVVEGLASIRRRRAGGERVVDGLKCSRRIHQTREIAIAHGLSRDAVGTDRALAQLVAFIIEEPERAVLAVIDLGDPQGTAHRAAVLVTDELGRGVGQTLALTRHSVTII